jgi:hypothetical protein
MIPVFWLVTLNTATALDHPGRNYSDMLGTIDISDVSGVSVLPRAGGCFL